MKRNKTFKIALGGICLALTVISMALASFVPGIELTLFAISSLFTAVMIIETGVGGGLLLYAGAAILGLIMIPNKLALIPYLFIFGYYAVLKYYIEKIAGAVVQIIIKVFYSAAVVFVALFFFKELIAGSIHFPDYPLAVLIAGGTLMLILYDFIMTFLINWYVSKFKGGNINKFKLS